MRFLTLLILCGGCTVAEQYKNGRLVSRSLGVGVVRESSCLNGGERSKIKVVGLSISKREAVLGYRTSDLICLPFDSCGTVFFVDSDDQVAAIQELFPDLASACLIRNDLPK